MGVIEHVPRAELDAFLARERADGAPDLAIRTSGEAPDLWVTKHCFPEARNRAAWGYDVGSEPARRAAVERAARTGQATLTTHVWLVQDEARRPGFLYCVPVYRNGAPARTPEEREAALIAVVYSPLVLDDTLGGVDRIADGALDMEIHEDRPGTPSQEGELLFDLDGHIARDRSAGYADRLFLRAQSLELGGQTWTVTASSTPQFEATVDRTTPVLLAVGGSLLSLLAGVAAWTLATSRRRAVEMARAMTADLARLARENGEARASVERALREVGVLRAALDHYSILSFTDPAGRILEVNAGFCEISGYTREELIGRTHSVVSSGHHPRSFWADMWRTIASGKAWRGEVCNRGKNGELYWVDSTIIPILDADGKVEKHVSIRFDITSRKHAESQSARLAAIVSSTEDAIVSKTLDGVITTWNRGAERLFGHTADRAVGSRIDLIIPPERRAEEAMILEMIRHGEIVRSLHTVRVKADGSRV
jgi:PAS domain S-box-containing protein